MVQPTETNLKPVIRKFNELYIQTRKKYLVQFPASYATLNKDTSDKIWTLNDGMLKRHLEGTTTYGIFSGGWFNKFITFDVDYDKEGLARWATLKLIDVLVSEFHINRADIHVSYSGSKGFHVDLFFDKPIAVSETQAFYARVLAEMGLLPDGGQIEFRPTWTQGIKLPLGIHQRTGRRCWFVDNETLTPIESYEYLLDVESMDANLITDSDFGLTFEQAAEFERVAQETDISANVLDMSGALQKARRILEAGRLTASGTRHDTTLTLACFFNSQGFEREEAIEAIMDVLHNTPREYFSKGSAPEYWRKEAIRLVDYAFDKDITLGNADKSITIYKSEVLAVLQVGTFRQKQLAYAMLVTSKRYGPTFYLTESSAMKMIGTTSKNTIHRGIKKLVEGGFMEYRRRNEIDKARSRELGQVRHKPNKYRLLLDKPAPREASIEVTDKQDLIEVARSLCTEEEIQQYVKRREYTNRWRR